jgi:hypothetical protein
MVRGFEFVEAPPVSTVSSSPSTLTSEGPIARRGTSTRFQQAATPATDTTKLPENPPLWGRDFRGRASGEKDEALLAFVEEVYGPYLPQHRNAMRAYLLKKNPALHTSLRLFGFGNLPEHLRMPSQREQVRERIKLAAAGHYDEMTPAHKRSVSGATLRSHRAILKKSL